MQGGGVAPGNAGQIAAVDFDDGEISERIGADQLGDQDLAVAHSDANVDRAINHVIVGDDVSVGRNDDAAADAALDLRLARHAAALRALRAEAGPKKRWMSSGMFGLLAVAAAARSHGNVDDGGSHAGGESFHGAVEREQRADAVVGERSCGRGHGGACGHGLDYFVGRHRGQCGESENGYGCVTSDGFYQFCDQFLLFLLGATNYLVRIALLLER